MEIDVCACEANPRMVLLREGVVLASLELTAASDPDEDAAYARHMGARAWVCACPECGRCYGAGEM